MDKIIFIGGSNQNGPGLAIYKMLQKDFDVVQIGREELYSDKYLELIDYFKPKHIIISTYHKCQKEIDSINIRDITTSIESKVMPLLRVSQNLNKELSSVLVFSGVLSDFIELKSLPTTLTNVCIEKMIEYLSVKFIGKIRFNCIKPGRVDINRVRNQNPYLVPTENLYSTLKMIIQNESINGTSIVIDKGYRLNQKQEFYR
ncbi:hypothetical protein M5U04_02295 [Xenorhabdus sp. XENO-1]|uniref:hypothetical protein n=1 Tax=Xenorhabdus bovienii TaxID=40576 RepID=UPI0020CA9AF3|nr:hypothetical protein [Xenorhabdus bovienii]MCP9266959.1 hypothetical protein [Xenorhabdus bovienii subsp. africana]